MAEGGSRGLLEKALRNQPDKLSGGDPPKIIVGSRHSSIDELRIQAKGDVEFPAPDVSKNGVSQEGPDQVNVVDNEGLLKIALAAGLTATGEEVGENVGGAYADVIKRHFGGEQKAEMNAERRDVSPFMKVQKAIEDEKTSEEDRENLIEIRTRMIREAQDSGYVNLPALRQRFVNRVKENRWGSVYPELLEFAVVAEAEHSGRNGYKENYEGMVQRAIELAALDLSVQGKRRREGTDPDFSQWLNSIDTSIEELNSDEQLVKRAGILDFSNIKLLDLVGAYLEKQEKEMSQNVSPPIQHDTNRTIKTEDVSKTPEKKRENFLITERQGLIKETNFDLWNDLSPEEQVFWQGRVFLHNLKLEKLGAQGVEDLTLEKCVSASILNRDHLVSLLSYHGVYEALSIYSTLARGISVSDIHSGLLERLSKFKDRGGNVRLANLVNQDDLDELRGIIRGYLEDRYGLDEERARESELIAHNLTIIGGIVEYFDADRINNTRNDFFVRRSSNRVDGFLSIWMRDLMHPRDKAVYDQLLRGATYPPNKLGEWIVRRYNKLPNHGLGAEHLKQIPLPEVLIPSLFASTKLVGGQEMLDRLIGDGRKLFGGSDVNYDKKDSSWLPIELDTPLMSYWLTINKAVSFISTLEEIGTDRSGQVNWDKMTKVMIDLKIPKNIREAVYFLDCHHYNPEKMNLKSAPIEEFAPVRKSNLLYKAVEAYLNSMERKHPGLFTRNI